MLKRQIQGAGRNARCVLSAISQVPQHLILRVQPLPITFSQRLQSRYFTSQLIIAKNKVEPFSMP